MRFVVVYQREPHARQMAFGDVCQPGKRVERLELARRARREFDLDAEFWIDDLGDSSRRAFGDIPHWAVVIDAGGRVRHKLPWADPEELAAQVSHLPSWPPERAATEREYRAAVAAAPAPDGGRDAAALRHDRGARLAWLVDAAPADAERPRWLAELAATGPLCQRDWATARLRDLPPPPPRKKAGDFR